MTSLDRALTSLSFPSPHPSWTVPEERSPGPGGPRTWARDAGVGLQLDSGASRRHPGSRAPAQQPALLPKEHTELIL